MFSEVGFFKSTVALSLFFGFIAVADGSCCLIVAWQGCWMVGWILQPALQLCFLGNMSL
ncbi:hypothetical protein Hanom_Chr12g01112741 [Helianthus anomalus]